MLQGVGGERDEIQADSFPMLPLSVVVGSSVHASSRINPVYPTRGHPGPVERLH